MVVYFIQTFQINCMLCLLIEPPNTLIPVPLIDFWTHLTEGGFIKKPIAKWHDTATPVVEVCG